MENGTEKEKVKKLVYQYETQGVGLQIMTTTYGEKEGVEKKLKTVLM